MVLLSLWTAACGDGTTEPAPPPNRAPLASGSIPTLTVTVGETVTVNVAGYFTDPDGDALIYAAVSSNAVIASVAVSGSVVSVTAVARGMTTVTVTARDPGGLTAEQDFAVAVPNRAPATVGRIADLDVQVDSVAQVDVGVYFTDPDGEDLEYRATSSDTTVAAVAVSGSVVTVTGVAAGGATVIVTATDPGGLSAQQTFNVTVPNRAPTITAEVPAAELFVGSSLLVDLAAHFGDPDGDTLRYAAEASAPAVAGVTMSGSELTIAALTQGETEVTATATDPEGLSAQLTFAVTVPNRAPVAMGTVPAQAVFVGETGQVDMAGYFDDPDGDALTYEAASSNPAAVSTTMTGGIVSISAIATGTRATITVTATDPGGLSAQQTFNVTVPNRAPTITAEVPAAELFVGSSLLVDLAAHFGDPDGDTLRYAAEASAPAVAGVTMSGSELTIAALTQGETEVTATATDPEGLSAQLTFAVTVPNRAPVAMGTVPAQAVFVGETGQVDMAGYFDDPDGDALTYEAASSNPAAVSTTMTGGIVSISAIATGTRATITVTATDPGGLSAQHGFAVTVPNRAPLPVGSLPFLTLAVGQTVAVEAATYFEDPDGDALAYAAASADGDVATVTVSGSVVTVVGHGRGIASVTVTATDPGGLSGQRSFDVAVANQAPVVRDSIRARTLGFGETVSWPGADLFRDPDGDGLTYAAGSSEPDVVRSWVSDDVLLVQGISPGTATVTFRALDPEGASARIVFDVTVLGPVSISGTDPLVLLEGATATVFGSGFSSSPELNRVSIGGLPTRVTAATGTALAIEVPRADCFPPRRAELRVSVGVRSDARTVGVTPRRREDLALPQGWYRSTRAGNGCLHLPGNPSGGEYLIGVVSASEDPASLTGVTLTGTPGDATVAGAAGGGIVVAAELGTYEHTRAVAALRQGPFRPAVALANTGGFEEFLPTDDTLRMRRARAHSQIMARSEALLGRLGRAAQTALADARREMQVGDTLTLRASSDRTCLDSRQVEALVRRVGNHFVWLEDLDNPAGTFSDSELVALEAFHASFAMPVHDEYFGAVSDVDGNGRVLALMTKEANRAGRGGWVWSGDLYPREQCATSNLAEITYLQVPDPDGTFGDAVGKQSLLDYYPSLLAHEVTHIIQFAGQVFGDAGRKASWELEGGASLAEQLVGYRLFGHGPGQELGWNAYNASEHTRYWYWNAWVADMAAFWGRDWRGAGSGRIVGAPEECSWVGRKKEGNSGPCLGNPVYGVSSMVLRYAMDRWGSDYAGGERAMMLRLTQSPSRGFASLVDVSPDNSWQPEHILADFYITLWLDLLGRQTYGMDTWNLYDIFGRLRSNARLQPHTAFSTAPRLTGRRVRAGSALYLHWTPTGTLSPTSIKVTAPGGGPVADHIAVWALRVW